MDKITENQLNNVASILSLINFMLNQQSLTNQDLAKILDKKTQQMLEELENKLDIIIKQNEEIILLLKK